MHLLGESCGPLTLDESINLLNAKEKAISELEKRVCDLESELSNEQEKHSDELDKLFFLLNDKDDIIKEMEKELEERPTQKLVNDLREKLKILEVAISEKSSLLETAGYKIAKLNAKVEKPSNIWIKRIFTGTGRVSKGSSSNNTTNKTTPVVPIVPVEPVASTRDKLIFFRKGNWPEFDLDDLLRASAEVLGRGTFGTTYKAVLESGQTVVVKRLRDMNLPENQFRKRVKQIGEMKHENLLPLAAYYYSKDEKLLVYDLMTVGSVSEALHANKDSGRAQLNWQTRAKVILSVSQSLNYIHSVDPTFCHGNIRSPNVLLTPTYEARLSDLGLYSLSSTTSTHYAAGGYGAPEITDLGRMTQKADVYSFGVLMLELLTGKAPSQAALNEDGVDLPRWVRSFERTEEAFDAELVQHQSAKEDMMRLVQVALSCTIDNRVYRPRMGDVMAMIEEILKSV